MPEATTGENDPTGLCETAELCETAGLLETEPVELEELAETEPVELEEMMGPEPLEAAEPVELEKPVKLATPSRAPVLTSVLAICSDDAGVSTADTEDVSGLAEGDTDWVPLDVPETRAVGTCSK